MGATIYWASRQAVDASTLPADWKLIELYDWSELRVALRSLPSLLVVDTSFDPGPFGRVCLQRVPTLWLEGGAKLADGPEAWEARMQEARERFETTEEREPPFASPKAPSLLGGASLWPHLSHELARANRDRKNLALLLATVAGEVHPEAMAREVGEAWAAATRSTDLGVWLGGNSFAFMVAGHGREEDAAVVARRFFAALAGGASMHARVGLAASPIDGVRPEDLFYAAEDAWRSVGANAKSSTLGIGNAHLRERVELAEVLQDGLRAAIEGGALELRYAPIRALADDSLRALEVSPWWPGLEEVELPMDTALELALEGVDGVFDATLDVLLADRWWPDGCQLILSAPRRLLRRRNLGERVHKRASGQQIALSLGLHNNPGEQELVDLHRAGVSLVFSSVEELSVGELLRWPLCRLKLPSGLVSDVADGVSEDPRLEGLVQLAEGLKLRLVVTGEFDGPERALIAELGCHEWQAAPERAEALRAG